MSKEPEEFKRKIYEALGSASMCWTPRPSSQVFNSEQAKQIGDDLCAELDKLFPTPTKTAEDIDSDELAENILAWWFNSDRNSDEFRRLMSSNIKTVFNRGIRKGLSMKGGGVSGSC